MLSRCTNLNFRARQVAYLDLEQRQEASCERQRDRGKMRKIVKHFAIDDRGAATMKYGLIAACLSLAIITVLQGIGLRLAANFAGTQSHFR